ncbi:MULTISPECIES: LuxR C-terminal-related transcriptional regulator [unclassified Saccharothrix]|uniref:LuxR C-terminal-related transcriptional regulator n=1 Tax=unclassified Saccharothrix TaxID=2593673 RepID=UPI00307F7339
MLRGRDQQRVRALVEGARNGHSASLVIRTAPGPLFLDTTALDTTADVVPPWDNGTGGRRPHPDVRLLRASGVEFEADLPFATLHQLLRPLLPDVDTLPAPQADALRAAFGLAKRTDLDHFLVGLATLTLLADHGPLLCVVEDAQWADPASLTALVFTARRLDTEGVALVFTTTATGDDRFAAAHLDELHLPPPSHPTPTHTPPTTWTPTAPTPAAQPLAAASPADTAPADTAPAAPLPADAPLAARHTSGFGHDLVRTARHLAAAATGPDESAAAALEAVADQARLRSGTAEAANALAAAAHLTPDPTDRIRRLTAAATLMADSGHRDTARDLLDQAVRLGGDSPGLVNLRARVEFEDGAPETAWRLLLDGGPECLVDAARVAWSVGDVTGLRTVRDRLAGDGDGDRDGAGDGNRDLAELVDGVVELLAGDPGRGLRLIRRHAPGQGRDDAGLRINDASLALLSGDLITARDLLHVMATTLRARGSIGWLPGVLTVLAEVEALLGRTTGTAAEALRIAEDTGRRRHADHARGVLACMAALRGEAIDGPGDWGRRAVALSHLGHGRFEAALELLEQVSDRPHGVYFLPDQVEAAVRAGLPGRAPVSRFAAWAEESGQPWATAVRERCLALVAADPEPHHVRAVDCPDVPYHQARSRLLYGEWLRRARRKTDARVQLRAALDFFHREGMRPWADRARAELRAAGESTGPGRGDPLAVLTPQELQIVRLAMTGATNKEIAAHLFLSPKTVSHHLYRAFPKLGVTNRTELAALDALRA